MPHLKTACSTCSYRNYSIPYTLIKNEKLTKALYFKTNLSCPQCKFETLKFKYGKNKPFAVPRRITFDNINSVIKNHMKKDHHRNISIEELHCGQKYDYKTVSTDKIVIKSRHKHNSDNCPNCKTIRESRTTYLDGIIPVIKDSYGIVEGICNNDSITEKEEGECVICMERATDGKQCQVCNKIYHKACIREWITKQGCCPHCRSPINKHICFYFFKTKSFYSFGAKSDDDDDDDDFDGYDFDMFRYRTPEDEEEEDSTGDNLIRYRFPENQEDYTSDDELIICMLQNLFDN